MSPANTKHKFGQQKSSDDIVRLVQLTDCHLGLDCEFNLAGVNTHDTFSKVLSAVRVNRSSSYTFVTGDIACEGAEASYQLFSNMMESNQLDYGWLPGNHDAFQQMQKTIPQPFVKAKEFGEWVVISLVSSVPGKVNGELSAYELQELSDLLEQYKDQFILLFVHHPPVDIQCQWLDEQRISNSEKLNEVISVHKKVKAIFTGHVHQEIETNWFGIPVFTTPSTCFQFTSHSDTFDISNQPPGYRWIELYPNGSIKTGVEHIACDEQSIDRNCMVY
jgi:Icc protein